MELLDECFWGRVGGEYRRNIDFDLLHGYLLFRVDGRAGTEATTYG